MLCINALFVLKKPLIEKHINVYYKKIIPSEIKASVIFQYLDKNE